MADGTDVNHNRCIRGCHAYGAIWTPTFSEHISCERPGDSQYEGPLPSGSTQCLEAQLDCSSCGLQYAPHFPACYLDVLS